MRLSRDSAKTEGTWAETEPRLSRDQIGRGTPAPPLTFGHCSEQACLLQRRSSSAQACPAAMLVLITDSCTPVARATTTFELDVASAFVKVSLRAKPLK